MSSWKRSGANAAAARDVIRARLAAALLHLERVEKRAEMRFDRVQANHWLKARVEDLASRRKVVGTAAPAAEASNAIRQATANSIRQDGTPVEEQLTIAFEYGRPVEEQLAVVAEEWRPVEEELTRPDDRRVTEATATDELRNAPWRRLRKTTAKAQREQQ